MRDRWLLAGSLIIGLCSPLIAGTASAQDYPSKPIRLVVANAPGSPMDDISRIMAPELSRLLGQPVIVENKPGAGQIIGYEHVAKQAADGYTIAIGSVATLAILPVITKDLRFDPIKDLPPFVGLAEGRLVLGSSSKFPWKTLNDLIAHARSNQGKLNYGSPSAAVRLTTESLIRNQRLNILYVPYAGGGGAYFQGLIAGDVQLGFVGDANASAFGEQFRALAITGEQRHMKFPEVPTFKELGIPNIRGISYSLNAPAGLPRAVIDKLYTAAARALQDNAVKLQFAKMQLDITGEPPELATKRLVDDARIYADIARQVGIQRQ